MTRILIVLLVAALGFGDDTDKGRKGNERYHEKKYDEAASLFREGLAASDESTDPSVRSGLSNNLGCSLNRLESYEEAAAAFSHAIETASSETELARNAYNGGNNAFQAQDPQKSLSYFRQALLADPANEDARFNYEFVRRLMQQQKESGGEGDPQQQDQQQDQEQQDQPQDQEQQQDDQQEDESGDDSQQQEQQQDEEQQQQEQEQREPEMSEEQAEQILQALQNDEEELMKQVWRMRGKPRTVDKDW